MTALDCVQVLDLVYGYIWVFCYLKRNPGPSRYRMLIFYSVTSAENAAMLGLYWTRHTLDPHR